MEAVINNTKLIRRVNIFALLILAVCVCAVAFLCKNMWLHIACTAALFLVMTIFGYWGNGLKFLVAFLISYGWLTFNVRHGINIPSPMLFTFLIELIPVFMAVYLVSQAPSGKLTAALRQLPLPSSVRLTVIVILRFVPTVASEFSDVLDAMKTRGLLLSPLQVVLHPLIIAVCVRMYPFQYGESALTETNRFGIPDAGHLQQLYPHPLIGIRVTKLLCCGKFTHQRSESTLVSQHAKRTDRVFAGEPEHCDKPMHMTSRPNGNHCFKPRNAGAFRQHDCSLCRKPSAQNA